MSKRLQFALLSLMVVLGFGLRLHDISSVGFNEDEVHKVEAARAYLGGNFLVNLEHPMLMKFLITLSVAAADGWNRGNGHAHQIEEEAAVRLPNVIFGSLTAVVLFLVAQEFFGFGVGILSAFLWATGVFAIGINRIAKEDTLLVFFTWLGYYLFSHARELSKTDVAASERWYAASGASFGLMLASKYFPHYLGLIFLYACLWGKMGDPIPRRWRNTWLVLGACALAFIIADPIVLRPSTLMYMLHYAGEGTITHHGYLMMGHLHSEEPAHFQEGMPFYFYFLFLAIKTPLPVLAAVIVGLVEAWKRRGERGPFFVLFMFGFWIVPFSLLGAKWLRYMLSWMPAVYIIAALGLISIIRWVSRSVTKTRRLWVPAVVAMAAVVFLFQPAWVAFKSAPSCTLYLNPLGMGRTGYYFPHDEMNDMGLREAIGQIGDDAPRGAMVGGATELVFHYYFHKFGRDDLQYFDLADQSKRATAPPSAYLVVQEGRKYLENIPYIGKVETYQMPVQIVQIGGADAVRVYRDEEFAELRMGQ